MTNRSVNYTRAWNLLSLPLRPSLTRTIARLNKFTDIDLNLLNQRNIRGLIVDIDGTLVEHGEETIPPVVKEKIIELVTHQINICIFSNHSLDRSKQYNDIGVKTVRNVAQKPNTEGFLVGMKQYLHTNNPTECAMVGDNFNTDGGANSIAMHFIHVKPIFGNESFGVKFTRSYADKCARFHDLFRKRGSL